MTGIRFRQPAYVGNNNSFPLYMHRESEIARTMEPSQPICVMPCILATDTDNPLRSRHTNTIIDVTVRVQHESIDVESEMSAMTRSQATGDLATLLGVARAYGDRADIIALEVEHDADLTERVLRHAVAVVSARWDVDAVSLIHRIGIVLPGEPVALVAVSAKRRHAAFSACEFLADYLESDAPFWKHEVTGVSIFKQVDAKKTASKVTLDWSWSRRVFARFGQEEVLR